MMQWSLCGAWKSNLGDDHPESHRDHHHILGERDEAERNIAVAADAGAFDFALLDIDSVEHRDRAHAANEECDRHRNDLERARDHEDARERFRERIDIGVGQPAPREEIVVEEHGREALDVLKFQQDRKSTRLNSSHMSISYAVFCLKKKK